MAMQAASSAEPLPKQVRALKRKVPEAPLPASFQHKDYCRNTRWGKAECPVLRPKPPYRFNSHVKRRLHVPLDPAIDLAFE